jgi:hypothetical protein
MRKYRNLATDLILIGSCVYVNVRGPHTYWVGFFTATVALMTCMLILNAWEKRTRDRMKKEIRRIA